MFKFDKLKLFSRETESSNSLTDMLSGLNIKKKKRLHYLAHTQIVISIFINVHNNGLTTGMTPKQGAPKKWCINNIMLKYRQYNLLNMDP